MSAGICMWMSAAMRAESRHASEMVSQLVFGETYQVIETTGEWLSIVTDDCGYQGWISYKQHTALSEQEYQDYLNAPKQLVRNTFAYLKDTEMHIVFPIFIGSRYPVPTNGCFTIGQRQFCIESATDTKIQRHNGLTEQQDLLLDVALRYMNAPYLWGGRTPAGIDCSGFVQMVFRQLSIDLPRDASQQVALGEPVDFVEEAQIGDIAFFANEEGKVVHTGIVCGHQQIIHASGHVQINMLDETGIFHPSQKKYTHQLRIVKRMLP